MASEIPYFPARPGGTCFSPVPALIADVASAHQLKAAIHIVAEMLGKSPRWVRAVRHGEPVCITEDDEAVALQARLTFARQRADRLRGELCALEAAARDHGLGLEKAGHGLANNRGNVP